MYEQIDMTPVVVEFGDVLKRVKYTVTVNDTGTFLINLEKQRRMCEEKERDEEIQCYLNVEIWNNGKVSLEVSVTVWERMEPIKLTFGEYEILRLCPWERKLISICRWITPINHLISICFQPMWRLNEFIGQIWNPK